MGKEFLTFRDNKIEKYNFCRYGNPIFLEDFVNLLVSNKISSAKKTRKTSLVIYVMIIKLSRCI